MTEPNTPEETPGAALARLADGELHLDGLRAVSYTIGAALRTSIMASVNDLRAARPPFMVEEDRYALVRVLADADDVLARIGSAFTDAAKLCRTEAGQELLDQHAAEREAGTTIPRMVVPNGMTEELVLRPKSTPGAKTVDTDTLRGLLARFAASRWHRDDSDAWATEHVPDSVVTAVAESGLVGQVGMVAEEVASRALDALWDLLASPKVKSTALDTLRRQLAAEGDDRSAGLLGSTVSSTPASWDGETVELVREAPKARRR